MKFFWIDLEMTGLDVEKEVIIEVAGIVTDHKWEPLDQFHEVVYQPKEILESMDAWCKKTHGESGLTAAVVNGKPLESVEKGLVEFIEKNFSKEKVIICGNSIHQDRKFIDKYMPEFASLLHYRMLDVTSFKLVASSAMSQKKFAKKATHRALDDIKESIEELKFYVSQLRNTND